MNPLTSQTNNRNHPRNINHHSFVTEDSFFTHFSNIPNRTPHTNIILHNFSYKKIQLGR